MNRRRRKLRIRYFRAGAALLLIGIFIFGISLLVSSLKGEPGGGETVRQSVTTVPATVAEEPIKEKKPKPVIFIPNLTERSKIIPLPEPEPTVENAPTTKPPAIPLPPQCVLLVNMSSNEIVAYNENYNTRIYPASLTKVMSLIVAVEALEDEEQLKDTVLMTSDMIDPMIAEGASRAGFLAGEKPTVEELLYGMILPSGADAVLAIAEYIGGSNAEFVRMMNEKAQEMGLKGTHFMNATGMPDDSHYSTPMEMAMVLEYAVQVDLCRKILSTYKYTVPPNVVEREAIELTSTTFSRMTGDEMPGVKIYGGKTGFTENARHCLGTFAEINGEMYIAVLTGYTSKWQIVYDTLSYYSVYGYGGEPYIPPK